MTQGDFQSGITVWLSQCKKGHSLFNLHKKKTRWINITMNAKQAHSNWHCLIHKAHEIYSIHIHSFQTYTTQFISWRISLEKQAEPQQSVKHRKMPRGRGGGGGRVRRGEHWQEIHLRFLLCSLQHTQEFHHQAAQSAVLHLLQHSNSQPWPGKQTHWTPGKNLSSTQHYSALVTS